MKLDLRRLPFRSVNLWRWRWLYRWEGRSDRMHRLVKLTAFNPDYSAGPDVLEKMRAQFRSREDRG